MNRTRRLGAALAEMIVAIGLAGLVAAIGCAILVAAERRVRLDAANDRVQQTTRDVVRLLSAELESALPESVAVRGDTALDLQVHIGVSVACVAVGAVVVLPGATAIAGPPFTAWRQSADVGDLLLAWDTTAGGRWARAVVDSATSRTDGAGCATTTGFRPVADSVARIAVTRLRLDRSLPAGVVSGAPVRVFRGGRWFLHRSGDGSWSLANRRCQAGGCSAAQPAAGPLASVADSGLSFRISAPGRVEIAVRPAGALSQRRAVVGVRGASSAVP